MKNKICTNCMDGKFKKKIKKLIKLEIKTDFCCINSGINRMETLNI